MPDHWKRLAFTDQNMDGDSMFRESREAVTVSLEQLRQSSVPFETLEEAFGPSSLGILLVKDLPKKYQELRLKLLSYASYLAHLPAEQLGKEPFHYHSVCYDPSQSPRLKQSIFLHGLEALTCPQAKYLSGWSHGKEALRNGSYDMHKGSFYVNCAFYQGKGVILEPSAEFTEFTAPNVWPKETSLPCFQETFQELCNLIIDVAALVARACDRYAASHTEDYELGYLERIVKTSKVTKARLLHYFPPSLSTADETQAVSQCQQSLRTSEHDSWCATHVDHGCLTGLTSAAYINESALSPLSPIPGLVAQGSPLPVLPNLPLPPDPETGLYIHARDSTITKVSIPQGCLGFQTGEALQVITGGSFKAVPHFVRAPSGRGTAGVARNTLAVFTQPNLEDIVDKRRGTTFGEFSKEVIARFS